MVWDNVRAKVSRKGAKTNIALDYDYCINCKLNAGVVSKYGKVKLEKHHLVDFTDLRRHNSVNNVVLLCHHCHKFIAHQGHYGYSLASKNVGYSMCPSMYDCAKIIACVFVAERLWYWNPYNNPTNALYRRAKIPLDEFNKVLIYYRKIIACDRSRSPITNFNPFGGRK
jgi:hypothetical protein